MDCLFALRKLNVLSIEMQDLARRSDLLRLTPEPPSNRRRAATRGTAEPDAVPRRRRVLMSSALKQLFVIHQIPMFRSRLEESNS